MRKKKFKNKQEQVNHVAKETGIDPKELDRMDTTAIGKVDELIHSADDDLLAGDSGADSDNAAGGTGTSSDDSSIGAESPSTDVEDGTQVRGDAARGEDVHASGVSGAATVSDHAVPTGTVDETQVETVPSETPKSPTQVETSEGQGNTSEDVSHGQDSGSVVKEKIFLGYHPATGEKVYSDEQ